MSRVSVFNYECEFIYHPRKKDKYEFISWNSPYPPKTSEEFALRDIKFALEDQKLITKKLKKGIKYHLELECMFIPNMDGLTYSQGFKLINFRECN